MSREEFCHGQKRVLSLGGKSFVMSRKEFCHE